MQIFVCYPLSADEHKEIGIMATRAKPKDTEEKKKWLERGNAALDKNKINSDGLMYEVRFDKCEE